ncbi:MAG TPA: magnesium transporter [Kiritimatiellia bacterium]|nr:magnesium transporter [Kiritimatiellia bacterium]
MSTNDQSYHLKELLLPDIEDMIDAHDWRGLRMALATWPPPEIADLLTDLETSKQVLLFRALAKEPSAVVFSYLPPEDQDDLLASLTNEETRRLLEELPPDDRTQLLEELPEEITRRLMEMLSPEDLREARTLLGYPEESVGRLMTPDYSTIHPEWSIADALTHIRKTGAKSESLHAVFVVNQANRLLGRVLLRHLVTADPAQRVDKIMTLNVVHIAPTADREQAVQLFEHYDLIILPVVGQDGTLLGIVTVDDILDVARKEVTEDFQKLGSVGHIPGSIRAAPVNLLYRRRIGWLLTLVGVNIISGAAIAHFEYTIEKVVALVFFLPVLIGSAGNAGSQSATLIIRALATGDIEMGDWFKMLGKELAVAALLGTTMALGIWSIGILRTTMPVALVVGASMMLVVLMGCIIGFAMPFVLSKLKFDPATASVPLIASICDIAGVIVYFSIATRFLI